MQASVIHVRIKQEYTFQSVSSSVTFLDSPVLSLSSLVLLD